MTDEVTNKMSESDNRVATWADEDRYWRESFGSRPYVAADRGYEFYQPGYQYGFESANQYRGRQWTDVESDLSRGWETRGGQTGSTWEDIKHAVRDAWDRVAGGSDATAKREMVDDMSQGRQPHSERF